jgi:cysteinyl-tRNA synthetase
VLKIYNTLGHELQEFKPLNGNKVKIYVCGPTVYSYLHVGNFRGPVFFNFVRNWLTHLGYEVEFAANFTDVDDKIIKRATEENVSASEVSEKYIREYLIDFNQLGLKSHDHNPKVTTFMPGIIEFIKKLIEQDKAYNVAGDVNFSINQFTGYGKLSGRNSEDLLKGVRIDVNEKKQNPLDFALWKSAKPGENLRGSSWPSPWGEGRPGWHIECSAMVKGIFGDQIDIHGGGLDLMFPHHENEIAQSESCTGVHYSKYWMHWNMLNFGGNKMSKSLGNVVNMREFLEKNHAEVYKLMMMSVHYRSLADFTDNTIDQAVSNLARIYSALALAETFITSDDLDADYQKTLDMAWQQMTESLNQDFSTPGAFAILFEQIRLFNSKFKRGLATNSKLSAQANTFYKFVKEFGSLMSLFQEKPSEFLIELDNMLLEKLNLKRSQVDDLVQQRAVSRANKDFTQSDVLRKQLTEMGISVSDTKEGSFWEVSK